MVRSARHKKPAHGLSFDVECYYQIVCQDYLGAQCDPTDEVSRNTNYLLDLLAKKQIRATFFTLGNVARADPALIRRLVAEGHELAVHGDSHKYITTMSRSEFYKELERGVKSLEDVAGVKIAGHRAPAFSVVRDTLWALDIMREFGLTYDSSIYPIAGRRYGIAGTPPGAWRCKNGLVEIPLTVTKLAGKWLPAAGGGYFRMFPYGYTRWALKRCEAMGRPGVTYFHPHEFELTRPQMPALEMGGDIAARKRLQRFNRLQSVGRGRPMRRKLTRLLDEFHFVPLKELAQQAA